MTNVPSVGNASFQISSQYLDVTCSELVALDNTTAANSPIVQDIIAAGNTFALTTTLQGTDNNILVGQVVPFNLTSLNLNDTINLNGTDSLATCTLLARNVDSLVACVDGDCHVDAMRNSVSGLNYTIDPVSIINLFNFLPLATFEHFDNDSRSPDGSSMTEWWLSDPSVNYAGYTATFVSLYQVPLDTFATNLSIVLNTLWQSTICNQLVSSDFPPGLLYNDTASTQSLNLSTTTASVTKIDGTQYICNKTFASILIIISVLLLVEALVSLVLMSINIAPDTLGYVSSYTRDNAYFPNEASHLDGLDRSSAMKDVYTILGDVRTGDEVGHIAFTSKADAQPLRKGRLYD